MKMIYKIIILCILIFSLFILIVKFSIDHTFNEIECSNINNISPTSIIYKVEKI